MYGLFTSINILTVSIFLVSLFLMYTTYNINKCRKNLYELFLCLSIIVLKIIYIVSIKDFGNNINIYYSRLYMIFVIDMMTLILVYCLFTDIKRKISEKALIIIEYTLCIVSFYLSVNKINNKFNYIIMLILLGLNICLFCKRYFRIIQVLSIFYIINLVIFVQSNRLDILIYSNTILDFIISILMLIKILNKDVKQPYSKYTKIISNINRSGINIKLYDEKLNNCRIENKIYSEDLKLKENNLNIILGQFNKSALLIDNNNYIINQDIVFENMFPNYRNYEYSIKLSDFLQENIVENEKFIRCIENVKYLNENITTELTGKDGRIFEAVFNIYDEENPSNIICILSDITYENKITMKTEESDIKYKKIAQNIPYSILLEKNGEIIYNNNNLDVNLDNVKNIILNSATKGEINFFDDNGNEICIHIDRIEFKENEDTLSLIEIKDMTEYKYLLNKLEDSTNEYETLIDIIPEAICVLDYESKEFEYANNTFYNLFKIQDIESIDFDEIYNDIAISSGNINESIKYIRKTLKDSYGGIINIESSIVLIEIDRSTKMILIMRDITEEIKVESMKKEIEESKIINKDIDDFFINMSHELLTPVNLLNLSNQYIQRMCKDVIDRQPDSEFANYISIMDKHIEVLTTLIDKIMELSKLEGNYHKDSKEIYDIVSLCEDIVTEVNKYTQQNDINIVFDTDEEEIYCEIDPNDISKAILTLLSFVVKNSKIKSTIDFNITTKLNKVIITIENIHSYGNQKNFDKYEEKILELSMSISKLIINLYKGKIDVRKKDEDSIKIEVELNIEKNEKEYQKLYRGIDQDFIYKEYKKICDL